jgi:hypothetical protein
LNPKEFNCYAHLKTKEKGTVRLYIQATIVATYKPIGTNNIKYHTDEKDRIQRSNLLVYASGEY